MGKTRAIANIEQDNVETRNVRNIPGTGLGLVVVQKCVELHSGSITIDSERERGTIATVTLCP